MPQSVKVSEYLTENSHQLQSKKPLQQTVSHTTWHDSTYFLYTTNIAHVQNTSRIHNINKSQTMSDIQNISFYVSVLGNSVYKP